MVAAFGNFACRFMRLGGKMTDKRILIIFVLSKERKKAHDFLTGAFSNIFNDIVFVSERHLQGCITLSQFCGDFSRITSGFDKIYFISDGLMPLTNQLNEVFAFMESGTGIISLWSVADIYGDIANATPEGIPFFLCVDSCSNDFGAIAEGIAKADSLNKITSLLCGYITEKSFFTAWTMSNNLKENASVPLAFNAEKYLEMGFPFLPYMFFKLDRMEFIKYGTDNVPSEVFKSLIIDREKRECLLEYFAEECDASRLKDLLQLNFIVTGNNNGTLPACGKYAVFVHLYYESFFERYIEYLNSAASFCDVFISVNTEEKKARLLSMAGSTLKSRLIVIICENRGRDLSALLVAFRPYTTKYEYFCFLHDKSSHENESETVGRAFSDCMWDNLLGDGIIPEVLSFFEENPHIGLLVPPTPYWGVYLGLKSDFWTVCHNKTLELSKLLGLSVEISGSINPAALGTAFWCRTEALLPLLEYPWRYEDFDEEPLKIDGTIGHALERILPYAALDRHFLTSWIISEKFVPRILESHLHLTERQMRDFKRCPIPSAAGKTSEQIGVRGALCAFGESAVLLLKSFGRFFNKRLSK